jgi:hypothetical protein
MLSTAVGAGRALWIVACLNAGLHVAALALAAWGMRPGTPQAALTGGPPAASAIACGPSQRLTPPLPAKRMLLL